HAIRVDDPAPNLRVVATREKDARASVMLVHCGAETKQVSLTLPAGRWEGHLERMSAPSLASDIRETERETLPIAVPEDGSSPITIDVPRHALTLVNLRKR